MARAVDFLSHQMPRWDELLTRECIKMLASTIRAHIVLMESPQPSMCPLRIDEYTSFRSEVDGIWHEKVAKCRWRRSQISNDPAVGFMADRNCTSTIWKA